MRCELVNDAGISEPLLPYDDLMASARRMLRQARASQWSSLATEQLEFCKAWERLERSGVNACLNEPQVAQRDRLIHEVDVQVDEVWRLLNERQLELSRELSRQGASLLPEFCVTKKAGFAHDGLSGRVPC
ncbi:hypothetical protein BST95_07475 [Halioglobus japonicus]|uniref:Flagellar protein FliT n=1 Tax=Halioglobus japonicus TaxID=930805 RepID=A0AAP8ME28_9GAMM|nr:flagellar protein FliT [Halioglobus japonicus]AQA18105.1 hypothetical protein BST95_07475 [Halioglobus japonicus]PLW86098.1 flagellar protein FliT [Halioglobus japonicus]GHD14484.1 hypothetical protein GCM10007052_18260 [Halioglobus japonicus]